MPFEKTVLDNGVTVVTESMSGVRSAALGLWVRTGSRDESPQTGGISHFMEHMLFKGTPTRTPLDISRAIEGRGGMFNAFTGEEATAYFAHLPWEHFDEAVDILADMFLNASMPDDEFEREKQVVLEEIRMYEDDPDAVVFENLQRALFPKSPLGIPISGSAKTLAPLRPADLKRYRRGHYLPSRTFAVVVGRFERDAAFKSIASRLGRFGKGLRAPSLRRAKAPFGRVVASTTAAKDVKQTRFAIGYRTFGFADRRRYAAAVFDAVLGRGMSSRLFQEVREKRGLSYDVSSRMNFFSDAGMWTVSAGVEPSKEEKAIAVIERELRRIRTRRVGAAELRQVKDFMLGNFRLGHEKVVSKLHFYGQTLLAYGRAVEPAEQVRGIAAVTADDVLAVANAILDPSVRAISRVVPQS